ncbi:hypothetical protein G6F56_012147 [Rhizopus delemar]|nr:hypothetical protein G6F56_012147 [Rhizopus delemar]
MTAHNISPEPFMTVKKLSRFRSLFIRRLTRSNSISSDETFQNRGYPKLSEKYGRYVKPQRKTKGQGATSHAIATGATAVVRLVRSNGTLLAVKEFKKNS